MSNCTDIDSYIITCRDYGYSNHYSTDVASHSSLNATIVHDIDINEAYYYGLFECFVRGNNSAGQGSYGYGFGRE